MKRPHFTSGRTDDPGNQEGQTQVREDIKLPDPDCASQHFILEIPMQEVSNSCQQNERNGAGYCRSLSPRN